MNPSRTTLSAAGPVSSLGRPTSSPAVPGPVSALGHVVPPGGAAASLSIHNNSLGSAQHHCREAKGGASLDVVASERLPKLTNAQIKKLPSAQRAQYKAQRKATEQHVPQDKAPVGAERDSAPMPRVAVPHLERESPAAPLTTAVDTATSTGPAGATASGGAGGSDDGVSARSGMQVTSAGGPGQSRADLGRD